jgi:hypothetical protein
VGAIVLGTTFFWRDLVAYGVGVAAAAIFDWAIGRRVD